MNDAPDEPGLPTGIRRPRPIRVPSRSAQVALSMVGVVALFFFVMQLTAPDRNGVLSGRGDSFAGGNAPVHRALR